MYHTIKSYSGYTTTGYISCAHKLHCNSLTGVTYGRITLHSYKHTNKCRTSIGDFTGKLEKDFGNFLIKEIPEYIAWFKYNPKKSIWADGLPCCGKSTFRK